MGHSISDSTNTSLNISLSVPRQIVNDLVYFSHKIPTVPVQRVINVLPLLEHRKGTTTKVSWTTIFTKAYAIVCADMPALRRAYLEYPRPRLYQHPHPIASVAIEREYQNDVGVFFAYLPNPNAMSLTELQAEMVRFRQAPVEETFPFMLWFAKVPRFLRRLAWWYILNVRGARKAEFLGTFGVTVYSGLGAESLHPISPLTTTMNYGVIAPDGNVAVRLVYDHRVMDGATVARALARLQEVFDGPIAEELAVMKTVFN